MNPSFEIADVLRALRLDPSEVEIAVSLSDGDAVRRSLASDGIGRSSGAERFVYRRIFALERLGAAFAASRDGSGRILLDSFEAPIRTNGIVELRGWGRWCLDPRAGPAAIAFDNWAAIALPGEFLLLRPRVALEATRSLAAAVPQINDSTILGGWKVARWLRTTVRAALADGDGYARAAAVGAFGRLWAPLASHGTSIDEFLRGRSPAHRAWEWFARLTDRARHQLEDEACLRARYLEPGLRGLAALAVDDWWRWKVAARRWVLARDELESLAFLLARERSRSELGAMLERIDVDAEDQLSMFAAANYAGDPRLRSVAWQEPDNWWGQLSLPR